MTDKDPRTKAAHDLLDRLDKVLADIPDTSYKPLRDAEAKDFLRNPDDPPPSEAERHQAQEGLQSLLAHVFEQMDEYDAEIDAELEKLPQRKRRMLLAAIRDLTYPEALDLVKDQRLLSEILNFAGRRCR